MIKLLRNSFGVLAVGLLFSCGDEQNKQRDPAPTVNNPNTNDTIQNQSANIAGRWHLLSSREVHLDANGNNLGSPITKEIGRASCRERVL